jgi:hypothetical protein
VATEEAAPAERSKQALVLGCWEISSSPRGGIIEEWRQVMMDIKKALADADLLRSVQRGDDDPVTPKDYEEIVQNAANAAPFLADMFRASRQKVGKLENMAELLLNKIEDAMMVEHDYSTCRPGESINVDRGCFLCGVRAVLNEGGGK